jgi:hypothetical protein
VHTLGEVDEQRGVNGSVDPAASRDRGKGGGRRAQQTGRHARDPGNRAELLPWVPARGANAGGHRHRDVASGCRCILRANRLL